MKQTRPKLAQAAADALARIEQGTGIVVESTWFEGYSNADQVLLNLERWLSRTSAPSFYMEQIAQLETARNAFFAVLSASQWIADTLIQDPDLAAIFFDSEALVRFQSEASVREQATKLLSSSTSYTHSLDRLRYLKGRMSLQIIANDIVGSWQPAQVWMAISSLACVMIELARDLSWSEFRKNRDLPEDCPVGIVGFGKLGGDELNFSSDIDLVFVTEEEPDPICFKYCEFLIRALTDKMGRGQLYRVDMRLRPFGGAGALVSSLRGIENYYRLYAEPWEIMALLRSRVVAGSDRLAQAWERIREAHCFPATVPAETIDTIVQMRQRTEESANPSDIKRSRGGIRDVEFLTQILQMAHGSRSPAVRERNTIRALRLLHEHDVIDSLMATNLVEGYTFLRQLEHRIQYQTGAQDHTLPGNDEELDRLAGLLSLEGGPVLKAKLELHKRTIGSLYRSALHPSPEASSSRVFVLSELGPEAGLVSQWFDALPEAEAFYNALAQNADSLQRVRKIALVAPRLLGQFQHSVELTELLLSGEIEELIDAPALVANLSSDATPRKVAQTYTHLWAQRCAAWVLNCDGNLGRDLSALAKAMIVHVCKRLAASFDVIALGSLSQAATSIDSDADLLLLVAHAESHQDAEENAQMFLRFFEGLKRQGAPINVDLRLRPDGRAGMLVRTHAGLAKYELEGMEMWERFALGQASLLYGDIQSEEVILKAAYAQPLTPERLRELLAMKKRIETERVSPQHAMRNVKIGYGGISDIDWFVHLHEMRYPTATSAGTLTLMDERLRALARAGLINALEYETLVQSHGYLQHLRHRLALLDFREDLVPENPDKLQRLAHVLDFDDGNSFLAYHRSVLETVRAIFTEGMERLRA